MKDELLVKYLLGEATQEEQAAVQEWIGADPEHQRYFDHFSLIWEKSAAISKSSEVDENAAWERFRERVSNGEKRAARTIPLGRSGWSRAAAILFLLACGGSLFYYFNTRNALQTLAAGDQVQVKVLPDGSVVTLNKNAKLSYPPSFKGNTRSVKLEGEAFFNITPDKQHPFVIRANDVDVKVVGTSFNVRSSEERTVVVVETGIVEVAKKQNRVRLNPREMAVVLKGNAVPVKQKTEDELYDYYRTKKFKCNNTPLWRLVEVINEAYGSNIVIGDKSLRNEQVNTTFNNDPLDKLLKIVSETLGLRVEKTDNEIILTKAGQS